MKKVHLHTNNQNSISGLSKGFSLVEILIAMSVFLMFVLATTGVISNTYRNARHSANSERATILAEEAIEASRNLRDSDINFNNLPDGVYGLSTTGNQWNFSGSSDIVDIFNRSVIISTINGGQKKATVSVSWADQVSQTNSVSMDTYLTDWHAPLNIGLTVDKAVINHGGTKTSDDFLPVDLSTFTWDNSVEPPVQNLVNIPIVFSPTTMTLGPGTYTFSTSNDPDYSLALSADCGGGSIALANGDAKLCNITYEQYVAPTVTTPTAISITQTTATLGANVISLGNPASISVRGVCWDTTPAPIANCEAEGGTTIGVFSEMRAGFTTNTTYYYRGYATNSFGTGYSSDGTFTTQAEMSLATVTTDSPVANITRTTASSGGNVTSDGGAPVTARGIVWDTSVDPTIALSTKTSDGSGTGSYSSNITGLACNTLYYVRAYATNSVGTSYGSNVTFTTSACSNISFVNANSASGTSITIPAHNVGDLLIMFAYRSNSNTAPTVPSGWITIDAAGGANNSSVLAYRIATGVDSGTGWTNATQLIVQIYRGVSTISPIGTVGIHQAANSKIITYPALALSVTDGSSWVIGSAGAASNNNDVQNPPTGMTLRTNFVGASSESAGHDTNGGVTAWIARTVTISVANVKWSARTLEIKSQ